jgi:CRISPR-associated protein Cas1
VKTHDNILYVTTPKSYLAREGTNILVRVDKETRARFPVHTLGGIVCFGQVSCSPFAMELCGNEGVGMAFHTGKGRFMARVQGRQSGNVLLRRSQHCWTMDPTKAANVARSVLLAKVMNCRGVLLRGVRDHSESIDGESVRAVAKRLKGLIEELQNDLTLERLRGVEGEAARWYFSVFDHLIMAQKDSFHFRERTRRPPRDSMNALLSFLYAILTNDVISAYESAGLDPQMGFLHADRPGRASLALDLVEELRPIIADRLALSLVNRQQVKAKGFNHQETGGVSMDDETRKAVLVAYQERKSTEITHPFLKEKVTLGLVPHVQVRLLARFLRGDLDGYPPFFWK